jgi:23S rRNA (adenine2503-C2)-methyltransferase
MEYILLGEVNDRPEHARELVSLLHGLKVKVNLIPHNHWVGVPFKESKEAAVESFIRILSDSGVTATIRRSRGRDAAAACGQLVYKNSRRKGQ